MATQCLACATLGGAQMPPGGILYDDGAWAVFLRARPPLIPGQGLIVLKRHCEQLSELSAAELAALGPLLQRTQRAYDRALRPARVHFGMYAEGVRHIHLHVFPRMPAMPAGNIPITLLHIGAELLTALRLRRPIADAPVAAVAARLRRAFAEDAGAS